MAFPYKEEVFYYIYIVVQCINMVFPYIYIVCIVLKVKTVMHGLDPTTSNNLVSA